MNTHDGVAPQLTLTPDPLPALLLDNAWLVEVVSRLTQAPAEEVCRRLYEEEWQIGSNVGASMKQRGITPHVWSDDLVRFYEDTDSFLYELITWNRNANKVAIRKWLNTALARLPKFSLDVLTYGDGIGCDSLYLTQAGHRVTYCDLGDLSKQFAQALFDAAKLPFSPVDDLANLGHAKFDAIVCLDVLEHVPDPSALVERLVQCLRPGGLLIVSAPFFAISSEFPTHLRTNLRHSGSLGSLYGRHGLRLVDGKPFHDPLVFSSLPIAYDAGNSAMMRCAAVRAGAMLLKFARVWSWPHRRIGRWLQRRGYRYLTDGLQPSLSAETVQKS